MSTLLEQKKELGKRVIKASDALQCCRNQENKVLGEMQKLVSQTFQALEGSGAAEALVMVPAPAIGYSVVTMAEAAALGAAVQGVLILATANQLRDWAETKAAYDILGVIGTAIGQSLTNRKSSCYECIKSKVLFQGNPRKRERTKILRRVG